MIKKIIKWPLMKLWALDKRTGLVTKTAMCFGVILGSTVATFAAGTTSFNDGGILDKMWAIVKLIRNILLGITIALTAWGGFSVASAFMNDKQNAQDTLKKFILGVGISASITAVLSLVYSNSGVEDNRANTNAGF